MNLLDREQTGQLPSITHPGISVSPSLISNSPAPAEERRTDERRIRTDRRVGADRRQSDIGTTHLGFADRRMGDRRIQVRRSADHTPNRGALDRRRHADWRDRAVGRARLDRESLFAEFQPLVRRLIRQYGDTLELRQDLSGEIYYRFCAILEAYDPARGVPLKPYLVRQLSASVYTFARRGWVRQRREFSYEEKSEACEPTHRDDPTRDWDDRLAMEQVLKGLPDAMGRLPKRQRQVVVWRYYEQRSFEEIAEILHVKTATARSLLRHGINNLRRHMGKAWAD